MTGFARETAARAAFLLPGERVSLTQLPPRHVSSPTCVSLSPVSLVCHPHSPGSSGLEVKYLNKIQSHEGCQISPGLCSSLASWLLDACAPVMPLRSRVFAPPPRLPPASLSLSRSVETSPWTVHAFVSPPFGRRLGVTQVQVLTSFGVAKPPSHSPGAGPGVVSAACSAEGITVSLWCLVLP